MTEPLARLLLPELRWDPGHGYAYLASFIDEALEAGVGGFVLTAAPREAVAQLTAMLHHGAREPLLIAAAAEAGAGGLFAGMTALPPAAALGALRDADAIRRAAKLTARELRALGVNWALAPVADLTRTALDPAIGARAFGEDAQRVAEWVVEWVDACQAEGVLACVKHFPGIGRATADPTLGAVSIPAVAGTLWADDLVPFRGAVDAGVASLLVADVSFPGLDASGVTAAHSAPLLRELLRDELHFEGLVASTSHDAVTAIAAGCDLLLGPPDLYGAIESLARACEEGTLSADVIAASQQRRTFWADWARPREPREPTLDELLWARQVADTVIHPIRGFIPNVGPIVDVSLVDDDAGAGWERPAREHFAQALGALGLEPRLVEGPTAEGQGALLIALFGSPSVGRGRSGYTEATRRRVAALVASARQQQRTALVVLFGPPRLASEVPEAPNLICCWSGDRAMQESAARRLVQP